MTEPDALRAGPGQCKSGHPECCLCPRPDLTRHDEQGQKHLFIGPGSLPSLIARDHPCGSSSSHHQRQQLGANRGLACGVTVAVGQRGCRRPEPGAHRVRAVQRATYAGFAGGHQWRTVRDLRLPNPPEPDSVPHHATTPPLLRRQWVGHPRTARCRLASAARPSPLLRQPARVAGRGLQPERDVAAGAGESQIEPRASLLLGRTAGGRWGT